MKFPSKENSIEETECSCPLRVLMHFKVSKFQIFIVISEEQDAKVFPVLSKVTQLIKFEWALIDLSLVNSSHSQTIIEESSDPETRTL